MPYIMVMVFKMLKSVVAIDAKKSTSSGKTSIPRLSQYHFFEFIGDLMAMWRYFGIGLGKRWNCTGVKFNLLFT